MKLTEILSAPKKAGLMPYVIEDGNIVFMFMQSSNAGFGGDKPMIAKGHIDKGESPKEAAIREAEEELGLKKQNLIMSTLKEAWRGQITGFDETYVMSVFTCQVKSKDDFGKFHYETEAVHWMTNAEFQKNGRPSQKKIVNEIAKTVKA